MASDKSSVVDNPIEGGNTEGVVVLGLQLGCLPYPSTFTW
jgi:hypothetical protein